MVDTDVDKDSSEVKVPYLAEKSKIEMYKRHKQDPVKWSISRLSQQYGATLDRTKAILFLMRKREEVMTKEKVLDIPAAWHEIYERYSAPPPPAAAAPKAAAAADASAKPESDAAAGEAAAPAAGAEGAPSAAASPDTSNSKEALANEYGLSVTEVGDIIDRMRRHTQRQKNVEANSEYQEEILGRLADSGVDISFRETATAPRKISIKEDYYPTLFGDDGLEAAKKELLDRIAAETKAEIIDFQETLFAPSLATVKDTEDSDSASAQPALDATATPPNMAGVKTDHLSRWKIAFRDLSWRRTQPTLIRTRRGAWRQANALEDALRSWRKHPSKIDMETYRDEVKQFLDPDGDEAEALAIRDNVLNVRRARKLAAEAAAKK